MGMAMSFVHNVFTPLAPWFQWLFAGATRRPMHRPVCVLAPAPGLVSPPRRTAGLAPLLRNATSHRPLRVVQVAEPGQPRRGSGRIVISGRMADVCAELDRLAALESRLH